MNFVLTSTSIGENPKFSNFTNMLEFYLPDATIKMDSNSREGNGKMLHGFTFSICMFWSTNVLWLFQLKKENFQWFKKTRIENQQKMEMWEKNSNKNRQINKNAKLFLQTMDRKQKINFLIVSYYFFIIKIIYLYERDEILFFIIVLSSLSQHLVAA